MRALASLGQSSLHQLKNRPASAKNCSRKFRQQVLRGSAPPWNFLIDLTKKLVKVLIAMVGKKKKGGMSKQDLRRQHQRGERPPTRRRLTHAGLAPELYTALHDIQRPSSQPLTIHGRQRLDDTIAKLKASIENMEKALQSARDILDIFKHPENEFVQASTIRIIDTISASLLEARQRLSRRQLEADADSFQLSWQVAYELQELEVRSHDQWIGRLDLPRQESRPHARPPTLRSANVPSPIRRVNVPGPSQRPQPLRQMKLDDFLTRISLNAAATSTPPTSPKAEKVKEVVDEAEKVEDASEEEEEAEPFVRCIHMRLHRVGSPRDLPTLKKLLKKSCEKTCGRKMNPIRRLTLCRPLPQKLKSNLAPQFSQLACEAGDASVSENEIIELPPIEVGSPKVVINSNERRAADDALEEQILHNETVPIVTIDNSSSSNEDTHSEPLLQIDGLLNTDQILDLEENDQCLRAAHVLDGPSGHHDGSDAVAASPDMASYALWYPVTGRTFDGVQTPVDARCGYETPDPQDTKCLCEDWYLHGFCYHHPRITDPELLGPQHHIW